jgi:hypothetical protein
MELHRRMGHIAPASARKLVTDGLVTRIALDLNSWEEHCEACIYARTTWEPVPCHGCVEKDLDSAVMTTRAESRISHGLLVIGSWLTDRKR